MINYNRCIYAFHQSIAAPVAARGPPAAAPRSQRPAAASRSFAAPPAAVSPAFLASPSLPSPSAPAASAARRLTGRLVAPRESVSPAIGQH